MTQSIFSVNSTAGFPGTLMARVPAFDDSVGDDVGEVAGGPVDLGGDATNLRDYLPDPNLQ